jgi:predicted transposase/invertase (TIGR01784 family)
VTAPAKPNYKDRVFNKLFSAPDKILGLYNAISQNSYPPETAVDITTIENVLYNGIHNDLSFIIDGKLVVLVEHQSSINPNMPLRLMAYLARIYDSITNSKDAYSTKLMKIPRPEFIVLYNGKDDYPDKSTLKLSNMFVEMPTEHIPSGFIELEVQVLNINRGHNHDIVQGSIDLDGYVWLVDEIRRNKDSGLALEDAIKKAVTDCANKKMLVDFLEKYGSEVLNMFTAEWNWDEYIAVQKEESRIDGFLEAAKAMLQKGNKPEFVAGQLDLPLDKVLKLQPE